MESEKDFENVCVALELRRETEGGTDDARARARTKMAKTKFDGIYIHNGDNRSTFSAIVKIVDICKALPRRRNVSHGKKRERNDTHERCISR